MLLVILIGVAVPGVIYLLGPALLLLYWTVLSATGWLDPRTLPAPSMKLRTNLGPAGVSGLVVGTVFASTSTWSDEA